MLAEALAENELKNLRHPPRNASSHSKNAPFGVFFLRTFGASILRPPIILIIAHPNPNQKWPTPWSMATSENCQETSTLTRKNKQ